MVTGISFTNGIIKNIHFIFLSRIHNITAKHELVKHLKYLVLYDAIVLSHYSFPKLPKLKLYRFI